MPHNVNASDFGKVFAAKKLHENEVYGMLVGLIAI